MARYTSLEDRIQYVQTSDCDRHHRGFWISWQSPGAAFSRRWPAGAHHGLPEIVLISQLPGSIGLPHKQPGTGAGLRPIG